jgi:hypothetical protein
MSSMAAGDYGTLYTSSNGMPHKVTKGSGSTLLDEQGHTFSVSGPSYNVLGGGYVHVLAGVS